MRISVEQGDEQFLQQMHGLGHCSIQDLCRAAQVTPTAVRQRLMRLQSLGMVSREVVRQGRGRPHHAYVVTEAGLKLLGDNYGELAVLLWNEIRNIENQDVRQGVMNRLKSVMTRRYGSNITGKTLPERMDQLRDTLRERGFHVEIDTRDGLPILRENHCPYHDLAAVDSEICELEQDVFEQVLGVRLTLVQCCRDGQSSCEFRTPQIEPSVAVAMGIES